MKRPLVTKQAYILTRLLDTPLWAIYNMLPFIVIKDLKATPLQLAILIAMKPIVSIFSMYWSAHVKDRPDRLKNNIILARYIGCLTFFLYPFVRSPWFCILSSGIYMTLAVGAVPAWIEVLKLNLSDEGRKKTFAWGSAVGYLGGGLLPILFGWQLDSTPHAWQWIFPLAATSSLLATFFQAKITILSYQKEEVIQEKKPITSHLLSPWFHAWRLLKERKDFAKYQFAFMIIGGGLMVMQPALYLYFDHNLGLSYVELAVALSFCKGLSYATASPLWAKWMAKVDIYRFSSAVTVLGTLFPLLVMSATINLSWLYVGYILYGIMQAGSEMSWNLSGPIFAKDEDSSLYTSVNVVTVGIRGMIFPFVGSMLCSISSPSAVMLLGSSLFLGATLLLSSYSYRSSRYGVNS